MASNESTSVPARLKDLKDSVKERFLGLLGIRQPKVLLEDEQEVFLQVGRTVWHAPRQLRIGEWRLRQPVACWLARGNSRSPREFQLGTMLKIPYIVVNELP